MIRQLNEKFRRFLTWRGFILTTVLLLLASLLMTAYSHHLVLTMADGRVYNNIDELPVNNVGLVLGTSKYVQGNRLNLFFRNRIEAATALYQAGKIKHLLVSGDNGRKGYDEPGDMRDALIANGIPDSCITLDYAGFRTLDSVVRANRVFGQTKFTVISQEFHNYRAVFIGRKHRWDVVGFNAKSIDFRSSPWTQIREYLARVNAVLDVYVWHRQPRFLGEPVSIPLTKAQRSNESS